MEGTILFETSPQAADQRLVEYAEKDGVVELAERVSGPDAEMVFGDAVHTSVLRLDAPAQQALLEELGGESLGDALRRLFSVEEGAWLSDVQDMLDRRGISYGWASFGPDGAAYRPPYFG